jgi:Protein of unknown function (DUF2934)
MAKPIQESNTSAAPPMKPLLRTTRPAQQNSMPAQPTPKPVEPPTYAKLPDSNGAPDKNGASDVSDAALRESIAVAAYHLAERRGFAPNHEKEDWLQAEAEVKARRRV